MPHPLSRIKIRIKKLPVFFLIYATAISAKAQVFNGSVSSAIGGTGRAAVQAGDAMYMNPATIVHLRGRHLYSSYNKDEFMVNFSDNTQESLIPGAIGYLQQKTRALGQEVKQRAFSLALAEFVMDRMTFGIVGHHFTHKLDGGADYQQTNGDLGFLFAPTATVGLGLVVYNVFGERKDVPEEIRLKTSVGAGVNYIYKDFIRLRADATSRSVYMAGMESYMSRWIIARFGYQNDTDNKRELWTVGAGFDGPKFGLNYAYQGNPKLSGDYRHSIDLQIPF